MEEVDVVEDIRSLMSAPALDPFKFGADVPTFFACRAERTVDCLHLWFPTVVQIFPLIGSANQVLLFVGCSAIQRPKNGPRHA